MFVCYYIFFSYAWALLTLNTYFPFFLFPTIYSIFFRLNMYIFPLCSVNCKSKCPAFCDHLRPEASSLVFFVYTERVELFFNGKELRDFFDPIFWFGEKSIPGPLVNRQNHLAKNFDLANIFANLLLSI